MQGSDDFFRPSAFRHNDTSVCNGYIKNKAAARQPRFLCSARCVRAATAPMPHSSAVRPASAVPPTPPPLTAHLYRPSAPAVRPHPPHTAHLYRPSAPAAHRASVPPAPRTHRPPIRPFCCAANPRPPHTAQMTRPSPHRNFGTAGFQFFAKHFKLYGQLAERK